MTRNKFILATIILTFAMSSTFANSDEIITTSEKATIEPEFETISDIEKEKKGFWLFEKKKKRNHTLQVIQSESIDSACEIDAPCVEDDADLLENIPGETVVIDKKSFKEEENLRIKQEKELKKLQQAQQKEEKRLQKVAEKEAKKKKAAFLNYLEKVDIEDYLMLSEAQIILAKENRIKGEENIKPILEKIKLLEKKIDTIERRNIPNIARDNQVKRYLLEIRLLKSKANELRKENVENFEKLLTPEQQELFDDIKRINVDEVIKRNNL